MKREIEIEIHASAGLQPVGLYIRENQKATISFSSGSWKHENDVKDVGPLGDKTKKAGNGSPLPDEPLGTLVGQLGDGPVFLVKKKCQLSGDLAGELKLGMNTPNKILSESSGALSVKIETFWPTSVLLVKAGMGWQPTGLTITTEQHVSLTVRGGKWMPNPTIGYCSANGYQSNADESYPLPGAQEGTLIGRIGSHIFKIGKGSYVPREASGKLFLMANDPAPNVGHKIGQVKVEISSFACVVTVRTQKQWTTTGIVVPLDVGVLIRATGSSSQKYKAAGNSKIKAGAEAPLPDYASAALVGRIGDVVFPVGNSTRVPSNLTGPLELGINLPVDVSEVIIEEIYTEIEGVVPLAGARPCIEFDKNTFLRGSPPLNRETFQTAMAWYKIEEASGFVPILAGSDGMGAQFYFHANPPEIAYTARGDSSRTTTAVLSGSDLDTVTGQWQHIAFVADGKSLKLYSNGILIRRMPYSRILHTKLNQFWIGATVYEQKSDWKGAIAEVTLWKRPLSTSEVVSFSKSELRGDEKGLLQYWPLHEGRGFHVNDLARLKSGMIFSKGNKPRSNIEDGTEDISESISDQVRNDNFVWQEQILPISRVIKKRVLTRGSWQSAGVEILKQSTVAILIRAKGKNRGENKERPNPNGLAHVAAVNSCPLPGQAEGALIGKVGSRIFCVGADGEVPMGVTGKLFLMANCDTANVEKNAGSFDVTITIPPSSEIILPHPARLNGYSGNKNSVLSLQKHIIAGKLKKAHTQANQKIDAAHQQAQNILSTGSSLEVVFASRTDGIVRLHKNRLGKYEAQRITDESLKFDVGPYKIDFAPIMAIDRKSRRLYWAMCHEWAPKKSIKIHSAMWDGSDKHTFTVNLSSAHNGQPAVLDAIVINPATQKLYLLHHSKIDKDFYPISPGREHKRKGAWNVYFSQTTSEGFVKVVDYKGQRTYLDDSHTAIPDAKKEHYLQALTEHDITNNLTANITPITFKRPLGFGYFGFKGYEKYAHAWNNQTIGIRNGKILNWDSGNIFYRVNFTSFESVPSGPRTNISNESMRYKPMWIPWMAGRRAGPAFPNTLPFWATCDPGKDRLFIVGRGHAWMITPGTRNVSELNLETEWPTSNQFDPGTEKIYWNATYGANNNRIHSMDPDVGKVHIGSTLGGNCTGFALNQGATTAYCSMQYSGIIEHKIGASNDGEENIIQNSRNCHSVIFEDPLADEQAIMKEVVEARKTAALEKAQLIAKAHKDANARKAKKQQELQDNILVANKERTKTNLKQQKLIADKHTELAKTHDDKKEKIANALWKAKRDTDAALADKNRRINSANSTAKSQKDVKLRELDAKRRSR